MNHLVFLDTDAGELEKISSGIKSMVAKEFDYVQTTTHTVSPGDILYFLRDNDECALRVKATVVRVMYFTNNFDEELSHTLKEMQPRLKFTEDQYNYWAAKNQVMLVEFESANKIDVIYISTDKVTDRSDWIAFEKFDLISCNGGS